MSDEMEAIFDENRDEKQNEANNRNGPRRRLLERLATGCSRHGWTTKLVTSPITGYLLSLYKVMGKFGRKMEKYFPGKLIKVFQVRNP